MAIVAAVMREESEGGKERGFSTCLGARIRKEGQLTWVVEEEVTDRWEEGDVDVDWNMPIDLRSLTFRLGV